MSTIKHDEKLAKSGCCWCDSCLATREADDDALRASRSDAENDANDYPDED